MASPPTTLYAILNLTSQAAKEDKDSYLREALLNHPDKNPENFAEANTKSAQLQKALQTLYDERKRREYDVATSGTSRDGPQEKVEDLEEENPAEANEVDFNESLSREFARGLRQEEVDEKRMAESLKKMNESLDGIEDGCRELHESLGRVEETIKNNLEPVIEGIFGKSVAVDCGGGKTSLVSQVTPRAEQEDSPEESPYEEDDWQVVEMNSIDQEEECNWTDETLNERGGSATELHRTARESAPSPEPLPPQCGCLIVRTMPLGSIRGWENLLEPWSWD